MPLSVDVFVVTRWGFVFFVEALQRKLFVNTWT